MVGHVGDDANHPERLAVGGDGPAEGRRVAEEALPRRGVDDRHGRPAGDVLVGERAALEELEVEDAPVVRVGAPQERLDPPAARVRVHLGGHAHDAEALDAGQVPGVAIEQTVAGGAVPLRSAGR